MELLKTLISLKSKLKSKKVEDFDISKFKEFEEIMSSSRDISEEEICLKLYGSERKSNAYRVLKYRLQEKLMQEIFELTSIIDHDDLYNFKILVELKNYTIALTLHKYGNTKEAIEIFTKNLKNCNKHSLTNIALLNIKQISYYYAFIDPNYSKLVKTLKESESLLAIYNAEKEIEKYNALISHFYYSKKGGISSKESIKVRHMITRIDEICKEHKSRNINFLAYDLKSFYLITSNLLEENIEYSKENMQNTSFLYPHDKLFFYKCNINIAMSYFHLKNYEESAQYFEKAIASIRVGLRNWFHDCAKYFTVLIRMKNYTKLISLYQEVISNTKSLRSFKTLEEEWLIRSAFIHLLIDANIISKNENQYSKLPPFSVTKFLNSITFYSKDKSGLYVTITVIKIIFLLLKKKNETILNLADSLTQYTYKYLKNSNSLRSNCFIRMILTLIKNSFNLKKTIKDIEPIYFKLTNSKVIIDESNNELEIIPYEDLWDIICYILENSKKK